LKNKINILGLGPGHPNYTLPITKRIIENSEIIVGGKRNINSINTKEKKVFFIKTPLIETIEFIKENYKNSILSVVVSGDSGFYSLTTYIKKHFMEEEIDIYPGISSIQYLFAKIGKTWEDANLISMHGREEKLLSAVKNNSKVGVLTDDVWTPDKIAKKLIKHGLKEKKIYIGENLSYDNEEIYKMDLIECAEKRFLKLNVMVVEDE